MENVNQDIEDLQIQLNNLRKDQKLKKSRMLEEFCFDLENTNTQNTNTESLEPFKQEIKSASIDIENIKRVLSQKSNSKDVAALVDIKANSQDVFRIFEEIKRTIEIVRSK